MILLEPIRKRYVDVSRKDDIFRAIRYFNELLVKYGQVDLAEYKDVMFVLGYGFDIDPYYDKKFVDMFKGFVRKKDERFALKKIKLGKIGGRIEEDMKSFYHKKNQSI